MIVKYHEKEEKFHFHKPFPLFEKKPFFSGNHTFSSTEIGAISVAL